MTTLENKFNHNNFNIELFKKENNLRYEFNNTIESLGLNFLGSEYYNIYHLSDNIVKSFISSLKNENMLSYGVFSYEFILDFIYDYLDVKNIKDFTKIDSRYIYSEIRIIMSEKKTNNA